VVGTGPGAEIANVLGVEADGLAADLVELVLAEDDLGPVDGGGEDAELGHLAHPHVSLAHVLRPGDGSRRPVLGDDEVGACGGGDKRIYRADGETPTPEQGINNIHITKLLPLQSDTQPSPPSSTCSNKTGSALGRYPHMPKTQEKRRTANSAAHDGDAAGNGEALRRDGGEGQEKEGQELVHLAR